MKLNERLHFVNGKCLTLVKALGCFRACYYMPLVLFLARGDVQAWVFAICTPLQSFLVE